MLCDCDSITLGIINSVRLSKDAELFSILRYGKKIPLKEIENNNKGTMNSFVKEKLKAFGLKNLNIDYRKGTITFDSSQLKNPKA